jgi:diacylglycerol kinase (ATP)
MKKARLIYNSQAGSTSGTLAALLEGIKAAGYKAIYDVTTGEDDLRNVLGTNDLDAKTDLVIVAGGDGSLRAVVKELLSHPVRPAVSVLPLGTANNIASMLMPDLTAEQILAGLARPVCRPFDVGQVRNENSENIFLEAAGVGLFATMLETYKPDEGKSPLRALQAAAQTLSEFGSQEVTLEAGEQIFSEKLVMLEVMNTNAVGPKLNLAPDAATDDGLFDVVIVREDECVGFLTYVTNVVSGTVAELPNVSVRRWSSLSLSCENWAVHADAEILPVSGRGQVCFELASTLELWLPEQVNQ